MKINKRAWLNPLGDDDTGSIALSIERDSTHYFHEAILTIRDCGKQIQLDFSLHNLKRADTQKKLKQRIKKVQLIKSYLQTLEDDLKQSLQ